MFALIFACTPEEGVGHPGTGYKYLKTTGARNQAWSSARAGNEPGEMKL